MAVVTQEVTDRYALYHGDAIEVMASLPAESMHLSIYSPPFGGLYHYSSSERDLSNCRSYEEFFAHYEFVVREMERLTLPGRMTCVHCMDVPSGNSGRDYLMDFPGDTIMGTRRACFLETGFADPLISTANETHRHLLSLFVPPRRVTRTAAASL